MPVLVDTNVLLDIITVASPWREWAVFQHAMAADRGNAVINPVIYAEFSVGLETAEETDGLLSSMRVTVDDIPRRGLFAAGKAFQIYRRRGGTKVGVPPDFFVGAHAMVAGWQLLTRDPRRYRTYFPDVNLITP